MSYFEGTENEREFFTTQERQWLVLHLLQTLKAGPGDQPDRSRLVPVAWQQWSEMEALIPSPAACEVQSVIKFFNAQSIVPIEIHRQLCQVYGPNTMMNADHYCETLRKLRRAIQNKRRGMLTAGVVLLHDNARPHTARLTAAVLTEFGWELFDHPPYNPDLVPSNFHVFLHLKKFQSSDEICDYFGVKITMYFAWLGHYTTALIVPAVVGFVFWIGFCGRDQATEDVGFVLFSFFNVLWASVYVEAWKRYSAELAYRWGTLDQRDELLVEPRPLFTEWWDQRITERGYFFCLSYLPKIMLAVVITLLDEAYYKVACWLNDKDCGAGYLMPML
ncbi:hypothetical protein ANN_10159 [Periplaneta americana]|uniref:Anoctamin n=1 Tax=Periplaneta americana TaxID=6978 RepID=A0ABQ8TPU6_PERAM|nr:hypothetical protein ANN_10159 [Periplaneta americana]